MRLSQCSRPNYFLSSHLAALLHWSCIKFPTYKLWGTHSKHSAHMAGEVPGKCRAWSLKRKNPWREKPYIPKVSFGALMVQMTMGAELGSLVVRQG